MTDVKVMKTLTHKDCVTF